MTHIPWIPIVERAPEDMVPVIVGQGCRTFAGWIHEGCWYSASPMDPRLTMFGDPGIVAEMGDVRATDFWLAIPSEPPALNAVEGGYPA